jgi:cell division protein FtsL
MAQYAQYVRGNVAVELEQEEQAQRQFTVLPGYRPEHGVRTYRHLSPLAVTLVKCAGFLAAAFLALALGRVLVSATTAGFQAQNTALNSQLDTARSAGTELEVQVSVLGKSDRISSIATEAYGMVPAESVATLDLSASATDVADDAEALLG